MSSVEAVKATKIPTSKLLFNLPKSWYINYYILLLFFILLILGIYKIIKHIYVYDCVCKVSRRLDLVYGGGSVGLMGVVSQEVHRGGRHVVGYIAICYI